MTDATDSPIHAFTLDNAETLHSESPNTFEIPPLEERTSLQPDELVKLVFRIDPVHPEGFGTERMWVIVNERIGARYVGLLNNDPFYITTIQADDRVEFGPEHVIAILKDE